MVTHSPTIALELLHHPTIEVILIGGRLFKHSVVTVGAACLEAVGKVRADTFFMGVTGVHPRTGLTTGDFEEAGINGLSAARQRTLTCSLQQKSSMLLRRT